MADTEKYKNAKKYKKNMDSPMLYYVIFKIIGKNGNGELTMIARGRE